MSYSSSAKSTPTSNDIIELQSVEPATSSQTSSHSGFSWMGMIPIVIIFAVFYFLVLRPQEKKRKVQEAIVNSVKKGEKILMLGGIYGTVVKVNDDATVEVEIAKDVAIKILKNAIADIVSRKQPVKK